MATSDREQGAEKLPFGTLVKDAGQKGKVGEVMGNEGPYYQLRPLNGGREWDALPANVIMLTAREELTARLAVRNAVSRGVL